jgi:hypothetical protein
MFAMIRNLVEALRVPSVEAQERAYLDAAEDRYDLEYRQRQVERGLFRPRTMLGGFRIPA